MTDPRLQRAQGPIKINGERDAEIRRRYEQGETLQAIGERFGLSYQRVSQIVNGHTGHYNRRSGR